MHLRNTYTDGPLVRIKTFQRSEGLNGLGQTHEAICCQVGAGDVLEERAQVDTGVLLGVTVGSCE